MEGDKYIHELTTGSTVAGTEQIPAYQGGDTVVLTVNQIQTYIMVTVNAALALKRDFPSRVITITTSATPTPNADTTDQYYITALATNTTFGAPTGTPSRGQRLTLRILDTGVSRTLAFNSVYRFSSSLTAPTATSAGKTMYLEFLYNLTDSKWDCILKLDNI